MKSLYEGGESSIFKSGGPVAKMNFSTIKRKYPRQWVLVQYDKLDDDLTIKKGRVIAHSSKKEDIYKVLGKTFGKDIAIEYTGPVQHNLTVMFFVK